VEKKGFVEGGRKHLKRPRNETPGGGRKGDGCKPERHKKETHGYLGLHDKREKKKRRTTVSGHQRRCHKGSTPVGEGGRTGKKKKKKRAQCSDPGDHYITKTRWETRQRKWKKTETAKTRGNGTEGDERWGGVEKYEGGGGGRIKHETEQRGTTPGGVVGGTQ